MIDADRAHLENHLKKLAVSIRQKEVRFFIKNFRTLGTTSTFLCGLSFGCLYMKPAYLKIVSLKYGFRDEQCTEEAVYIAMACLAIGCNMMVMAISAYSIIFGMDLAIRGQEGSMSRAVTSLYQERRFVLRLFWCAVIFTSCTGISLAWVKFKVTPRAGVVSVFVTFGVIICTYIQCVVREKFKFPEDTHKKPDEFLLKDGYDPEHGTVKAQLKSAYGS